jgi:hypothetical protein
MRTQIKHYIAHDLMLKVFTGIVVVQVFVSSRWNLDPYHEGALFPSSVGMAQGKVIFRDVNNQYGSLVAIFNAPFHFLFGNYLFVSRLVSAATFLLTAYLTYVLLRVYLTRTLAHAISLFWLVLSPTWAWFPGHDSMTPVAWPNHFAVMLSLVSFILLRRVTSGQLRYSKQTAFISGWAAFFVTQARFELYALWIIQMAIIFIFVRKKSIGKNVFRFWFSGSIGAATINFSYLALNSGIGDWFNQTIKVWFSNPPDLPVVNLNYFIFNFASFFMLLAILFLIIASNWIFWRSALPAWLTISLVSAVIYLISEAPNFLPSLRLGDSFEFKSWSQHIFDMVLFSPINFVYTLGGLLLLFQVVMSVSPITSPKLFKLKSDFDSVFLGGMAFGFLLLTHNFNAPYTGITIAPFLGYLASALQLDNSRLKSFGKTLVGQVRNLFIAFSLVSSSLFFFNLTQQTSHFQTPMLKGITTFDPGFRDFVDVRFAAIATHTKPDRMWMMCNTGLYTVSLGGYLGADEWSWNQQPELWMQDRPLQAVSGDSLVTCQLSEGEKERVMQLEQKNRLVPVYLLGDFVIYQVLGGKES